ncbi:(d)CMP kinase [candidate division KSB3 bacterium]|uniref:Cytidylate kinase n=1 Tax=candidate division KSB3 bacterium TaxID=2044937 RepID=A0A9D5Q577_9BACT|nr:(d)CMP kinase [candidate division KSB3 bacterium]MBD3324028.1 (d)CMP kinase [candidate division KSB3 bacterium]
MTPQNRSTSASDTHLVIAIDGPAGSGKSSVGDLLAKRLRYVHISTGAIYRAIGWKSEQQGIAPNDIPAMQRLIAQTTIEFRRREDGTSAMIVDGDDVSEQLTTNEAGLRASTVAAIPEVRQSFLALQRRLGRNGGVILDGRDIGTVVFPDADVKFYLDASPQERAHRRFLQLQQQGRSADLAQLIADIKQRDHDDSTRTIAPLRQAEDAVYIDSTHLTLPQVVEKMMHTVRQSTEE